MKRTLLFVCTAAAAVAFASCSKESSIDPSISGSKNIPIEYTAYAGSAVTRGTAINDNVGFQSNPFEVMAIAGDNATSSASAYFNFSTVTYADGAWGNTDVMYWPSDDKTLHFAAYSPSTATTDGTTLISADADTGFTFDGTDYGYTFPYAVSETSTKQIDLMYAVSNVDYTAPEADKAYDATKAPKASLHFKHALTQIAFTATADNNIDVYVKSVKICNVYNKGVFTATKSTVDGDASDSNPTVGDTAAAGDKVNGDNFGSWALPASFTAADDMSHYVAPMGTLSDIVAGGAQGIKVAAGTTAAVAAGTETPVPLTSTTDALMLMPQSLTEWVPDIAPQASTNVASNSYLAIDCVIYHKDIVPEGTFDAAINNGVIFVPFSTKDIDYSSASVDTTSGVVSSWLPGYKITYCLAFGGGYTPGDGDKDPEPGTTPKTETPTLRPITYTITVDDWVDLGSSDKTL